MAISYFGIASTPANGGTNATSPTAITPPTSMIAGDLVIVVCGNRLASDTHAVSAAGGQTWTTLTNYTNSVDVTVTWFYCIFDGTWDTNPSFSHGGTNNTCIMIVFRRTSSSYTWSEDNAEAPGSFAAPTTPFDEIISGASCASNSVAIASWFSSDNNTWALQTGASWTQPSGGSVDNSAASNTGMLVAYRLMPSGGFSGDPKGRQTAVGGDAGVENIMSFLETGSTGLGISGFATYEFNV